jgi:hypothetical protein
MEKNWIPIFNCWINCMLSLLETASMKNKIKIGCLAIP